MFLVVRTPLKTVGPVSQKTGLCIAGAVASRARWRFGIFAMGLQMAIKLKKKEKTARHDYALPRSPEESSLIFDNG